MSVTPPVYGFKEDPNSSHNQISQWVNQVEIKKVLDIGCAGGFLARALGNKWNGELIGIEKDPSWISSEGLKGYKKIYWIDLEKKDISQVLGKKHKNFDAIVAADILEHLKKPEKILEEIKKVLRPRGYLIVSLPNANYLPVLIIRLIFPNFRMSKGPLDRTHKHFYNLRSAKKILQNNNFNVVKTQTTPPPLELIFQTFVNTSLFKIIYNINHFLAVLIPNLFAYQLLFLMQLHKEPT
jgi:2-polyprenyl-3-methyl-5-hydroxy-6-metoxy-1,4-benzoquinol methylase